MGGVSSADPRQEGRIEAAGTLQSSQAALEALKDHILAGAEASAGLRPSEYSMVLESDLARTR